MTPTLQNFVGGQLVASTATQFIDVTTPHTGELIARCPVSTVADVDAAVQAAHTAFGTWSKLTVKVHHHPQRPF
jgi:malonate-semialdehyde dehydrogenase (acetylating)/methylmalonate-semialdehyde dehydrogenase